MVRWPRRRVLRGEPEQRAFSAFGYRDGKLAVVESINRTRDHTAAKRIIGTPKMLTPEDAANPAFDLSALAKRWPGESKITLIRSRLCTSGGRRAGVDVKRT